MTAHRPRAAVAQHSIATSLALHLVPGAITTAAYVLAAGPLMARGYPALLAVLLATLLVLIPLELGYLLREARRINGSLSLDGVVLNREPLSLGQYILWPLLLFIWGFVSSALASPVDRIVGHELFSWLPSWYFVASVEQFASYSRSALMTTFVLGVMVVGFAGPIVEELYFRGYLLPRMARFGRLAPLLHGVLFSLYHFWTPWQNLSRILLSVPMAYLAWWKRNLYLPMLAHITLNTIVWIITFGAIVRSHP
jgi:membrane protease YdiL (CAAX protease family)